MDFLGKLGGYVGSIGNFANQYSDGLQAIGTLGSMGADLYSGYQQQKAAGDQMDMMKDHYAYQRRLAAEDYKRRQQAQNNVDSAVAQAYGGLGTFSGGA